MKYIAARGGAGVATVCIKNKLMKMLLASRNHCCISRFLFGCVLPTNDFFLNCLFGLLLVFVYFVYKYR